MRRHSIVAVVRHRRRQIGQLTLVRSNVRARCRLCTEMQKGFEHVRMIRERAEDIDIRAVPGPQSEQQGARFRIGFGIIGIDKRNAGHNRGI